MFVIGETRATVNSSKLQLPKEYHLKCKNRKIYGVWVGNKLLYLSDEIKPLKAKSNRDGMIYEPYIDIESKLEVAATLEKKEAMITGCISTIEIRFL